VPAQQKVKGHQCRYKLMLPGKANAAAWVLKQSHKKGMHRTGIARHALEALRRGWKAGIGASICALRLTGRAGAGTIKNCEVGDPALKTIRPETINLICKPKLVGPATDQTNNGLVLCSTATTCASLGLGVSRAQKQHQTAVDRPMPSPVESVHARSRTKPSHRPPPLRRSTPTQMRAIPGQITVCCTKALNGFVM